MKGKEEHWYRIWIKILFLSVAGGWWYAGSLIRTYDFPHSSLVQGIRDDGWTGTHATFNVQALPSLMNHVVISFDPWRPKSEEPPRIALSWCEDKTKFLSLTKKETVKIPLTEICSGGITLTSLNPFRPPGESQVLGIRVTQVTLQSPLWTPFPSGSSWILWSLRIFALTVLVTVVGRNRGLLFAVLLCALGAVIVSDQKAGAVLTWWVLFSWVGIGALLYNASLKKESQVSSSFLMMLLIVGTGAGLRFWGITFGLPDVYHPDETPKTAVVLRMIQEGSLNPHYFLHPSLLLYLSLFFSKLLSLAGVGADIEYQVRLGGRLVSAVAGTCSIALLYYGGKILRREREGMLAALFFALAPLTVTCSRYFKEDALLTCWILAVSVSTLCYLKTRRLFPLLAAFFFSGLAIGTKYTGILASAIPFVALAVTYGKEQQWRTFIRYCVIGTIVFLGSFILTTPFALLSWPEFIAGFAKESGHMTKGHEYPISPWSYLWVYHVLRSMWAALTPPIVLLALTGIGVVLRRRDPLGGAILALFLLFYLPAEYVRAKPPPQCERYILASLPFLCALAAYGVQAIQGVLARRSVLSFTLLFLIVTSMCLSYEVTYDTREKAALWLKEHIPPGARVAVDFDPYMPVLREMPFTVVKAPQGLLMHSMNPQGIKELNADYAVFSSFSYGRFFAREAPLEWQRKAKNVLLEGEVVHKEIPVFGSYGFHSPLIIVVKISG